MFQCSSASRKFLNGDRRSNRRANARSFSALQRAENSSMVYCVRSRLFDLKFQCSSASRKFLNLTTGSHIASFQVSVLFSEPKIPQSVLMLLSICCSIVSVLFSEPKIPQSCSSRFSAPRHHVSVLFSVPKIPQFG